MQNAARAKQLAHAELEQAKVKDDAEWEVPANVRKAWELNGPSRRVSLLPVIGNLEELRQLMRTL
jgi:hypothetical protein